MIEDRRLYIVGTEHRHQFGPCRCPFDSQGQSDAFAYYLKEQCLYLNIRTVAEEMNSDVRRQWSISQTVPESVALELNLEHIDCDPNEKERSELGILNEGKVQFMGILCQHSDETVEKNVRHEYDKREEEWLRRFSRICHWPVLLVCGYDHSSSLLTKAKDYGLCSRLIVENWIPPKS